MRAETWGHWRIIHGDLSSGGGGKVRSSWIALLTKRLTGIVVHVWVGMVLFVCYFCDDRNVSKQLIKYWWYESEASVSRRTLGPGPTTFEDCWVQSISGPDQDLTVYRVADDVSASVSVATRQLMTSMQPEVRAFFTRMASEIQSTEAMESADFWPGSIVLLESVDFETYSRVL